MFGYDRGHDEYIRGNSTLRSVSGYDDSSEPSNPMRTYVA